MARWITVTKPFEYRWPDATAITVWREEHLGDHFVKDEIADFAIENGYASEGKLDEKSRSTKGKREKAAAKASDAGSGAPMGDADAADADRASDRPAVDDNAE